MADQPRVSQTSIARTLGISQALVSKVLNGHRDRISPQTYDAIWAHALSVGYRPKGMTPHTSVALGGNRQIGIVLRTGLQPFQESNFFSHVQAGLHRSLLARGYALVMLGSEDRIDLATLGPIPPALVVLGAVNPKFIHALRQRTRRIVSIMGNYPGLCHTVRANEAQSIEQLVSHLIGLGHRRFGWIGGLPNYPNHQFRFETLQNTLKLHDCDPVTDGHRVNILHAADRHEGRQAIAELLQRPGPRPTAVIAFNGVMARGAVNALLQRGPDFRSTLSLVAIDATRACVEEEPHITCASTTPEKLGEKAADLLLESTGQDNEDYQNIILASQFHLGATTGPCPPEQTAPPAPRKKNSGARR